MQLLLVTLLLFLAAQADAPILKPELQPLLEKQFEIKLTRQEEADLRALFAPLLNQLQKPVPVVAPSPAPAR